MGIRSGSLSVYRGAEGGPVVRPDSQSPPPQSPPESYDEADEDTGLLSLTHEALAWLLDSLLGGRSSASEKSVVAEGVMDGAVIACWSCRWSRLVVALNQFYLPPRRVQAGK